MPGKGYTTIGVKPSVMGWLTKTALSTHASVTATRMACRVASHAGQMAGSTAATGLLIDRRLPMAAEKPPSYIRGTPTALVLMAHALSNLLGARSIRSESPLMPWAISTMQTVIQCRCICCCAVALICGLHGGNLGMPNETPPTHNNRKLVEDSPS